MFLFMQSQDDAKKGDFNLVTCVMWRGYQHLDETLAENQAYQECEITFAQETHVQHSEYSHSKLNTFRRGSPKEYLEMTF